MSDTFSKVQVITGVARRRRFSTELKLAVVAETMQHGMSISYVARGHGLSPSLMFRWMRLMSEGGQEAVRADDEVVAASEVRRLEDRVRELSGCWAARQWSRDLFNFSHIRLKNAPIRSTLWFLLQKWVGKGSLMRIIVRSFCIAIALMLAFRVEASVITVGHGAGYDYQSISSAVDFANQDTNPSDYYTIQVAPGTYTNDSSEVTRSMTIEAVVPATVILLATMDLPNEKGIILTDGFNTSLTVNGLVFEGAHIADTLGGNGAGIRDQNSGPDAALTVLNSTFTNNQTGILQGNDIGEVVTVGNSLFENNGNPNSAVFQHALYVNTAESLTVENSTFCGQLIGHDLKSRAMTTTVRNSHFYEGAADPDIPTCQVGSASFSIDTPNGGAVELTDNEMFQGPASQNVRMVDYGEEGLIYAINSDTVTGNLFANTKSDAIGIYDPPCVPVQLSNNTFDNVPTPVSPPECAAPVPPIPTPEPSTGWLLLTMAAAFAGFYTRTAYGRTGGGRST